VRLSLIWTVSVLVGMVLLIASGLKLYGVNIHAVSSAGWFRQPWVQLLISAWEMLLGLCLISGWCRGWTWIGAIFSFALFAVVNFYQIQIGQASCQCFGDVIARPWFAFCVDVACLTLLIVIGYVGSVFSMDFDSWASIRRPSYVFSVLLISFFLLLTVMAWGIFRYGSIYLTLARIGNRAVTVDTPYLDFGFAANSEVLKQPVTLRNWTNGPIRVIGGSNDVSCSLVLGEPLIIPPDGTAIVFVQMIAPKSGSGIYNRRFELWTDYANQKVVNLDLVCQITN